MSDPQNPEQSDNYTESQNSVNSEDERVNGYVEVISTDNFTNFFNTAKKHRLDGELGEAILIFKALIEKGTEIFGSELSFQLADVYFQMGDTWMEEIEAGGEQLMGNEEGGSGFNKEEQMAMMNDIMLQVTEAQNGIEEEEEGSYEDGEAEGEEEDDGEEEGEAEEDENLKESEQNGAAHPDHQEDGGEDDSEPEDIQVAWENIETARVILDKYLEEHPDLPSEEYITIMRRIAHCYLRLGNCENRKENFTDALGEYGRCLEALQVTENPKSSRLIAEVCFLMGNTYLYEFEANALENALVMYRRAKEILEAKIEEKKGQEDLESRATINDLKDICFDLEEKIEELEDEIVTNRENDINKEKIKAIAGNVNDFPKSQFGKEEQVKKLGNFGKKREVPAMEEEKSDLKKVRMSNPEDEAQSSN